MFHGQATAFAMDRLPDEILQKILNYVMMRDDPFCIQEYFHDRNGGADRDLQRLHHSQRSHLLDWLLVVGTSQRLRRLGKEAFFSQKVFVMDSQYASKLRNLEAEFLTTQDQHIAVGLIRAIVLIKGIFLNSQDEKKFTAFYRTSGFSNSVIASPSSFLNLSSWVLSFPRLERLDHLFGYRPEEGVRLIVPAAQDRKPAWSSSAWSYFKRHLDTIGVPTSKLDMGVMICEGTTWYLLERGLYWNIIPMLQAIAHTRAIRREDTS